MPEKPWPIWLLVFALLVGCPAVSFIYFPLLLRSGTLPFDGDSIAIPLAGSLEVTVVLSPFVLAIAWACLRNYNSRAKLLAWRRDRPVRSLCATLAFGSAAALFAVATVELARSSIFWFDGLWVAYSALWVLFMVLLRAAVIEQLPSEFRIRNGS